MSALRSLFLSVIILAIGTSALAQTLDLAGEWDFCMGEKAKYVDQVNLPGSMLTNHRGHDVDIDTQWTGSIYDSSFYYKPELSAYRVKGNVKFPFFLTPDKEYVGKAWYGRTVVIPAKWKKQRVFLHLERPHIETTVVVNGEVVGRDSSLCVPHEFEITPYINAGQENRIDICVYNGIENVCVGQDSHSVTDQTQGNWNGIVGRMELRARPQSYIDDLQIYPNIAENKIRVLMHLDGVKKRRLMHFSLDGRNYQEVIAKVDDHGMAETTIDMPDNVQLWSEFDPYLYVLTAVLGEDTLHTEFGMREIRIEGRQFLVNDTPVWMRGTVENCCFPLTGYPPTDVESWTEVFTQCKAYGLNMMRFHSYCPPEAAFIAADRLGFYLQPEGPSWPNHGVKLGNGMSIDHYLLEETERMVRAYGNHPSFCMLAAGNEPAGNWVEWTEKFVKHWEDSGDTRRVYCSASVGGGWAFEPHSQYHVRGRARGLEWNRHAPSSTDDFREAITVHVQKGRTETKTFDIQEPFLSHEAGQWCAFPDLSEVSQYTGAYKAKNFELFADLLAQGGMASQAQKFLMASGRLQTLAYKFDIERNLRTPEYAGFQLLSLNDYSGQGTALVGVLNVFWREKGYCSANDWTQFCSSVVPLARFPKFVYTSNEALQVPVELYNASGGALEQAQASYTIYNSTGQTMEQGILTTGDLPLGKNIALGEVRLDLSGLVAPAKYTLSVGVQSSADQKINNQWDFWVYPAKVDMPSADGICITDTLDAHALEVLSAGGRVLITAAGKVRMGADIKQNYLPVFWNTSWFKMRPPHTTGVSIDTSHPLFDEFPTDDWGNLNWWELVNNAQVMNLGELPADYQPPIQPIDTWHLSRKIGMLVEANVGGGRLLITSMDITQDLDQRPVARQMRKAILSYMQSDEFRPTLSLEPEVISDFFEKDAPQVDMYTHDSPDELKPVIQ